MMYYFANGMEQRGPYSKEEMAQFGLRPDTLVWREGMANWQRMDSVAELMALIPHAAIAPPADVPVATVPPPQSGVDEIALSPPPAPAASWTVPQTSAAIAPGQYP